MATDGSNDKWQSPQPMAVTSGNVVRIDRGDRPARRSTPAQAIVDPRTGQAPTVSRPIQQVQSQVQQHGFSTVADEGIRTSHRRSSSWDGMARKLSPTRTPSPLVDGVQRVSQMTDEQLCHYVANNRPRNSPSPGRTVKYTRKVPPHSPTLKSRSSPEDYSRLTARSSSPRTSAARKLLERELDEFCDELAEIHQFESAIEEKISELQITADSDQHPVRDGCKPGNAKYIITTPPRERFKSPKHSLENVPPLTGVLRPKTQSRDGLVCQPFIPGPMTTVSPQMDTEKSAFFTMQPSRNNSAFYQKH